MCGRFTQVVEASAVPDAEWPDRWNSVPIQVFLVCRLDAAGRWVLSLQRWGLVPSWARDRAIGSRLINAREVDPDNGTGPLLRFYNAERRHQGLGRRTPDEVYAGNGSWPKAA